MPTRHHRRSTRHCYHDIFNFHGFVECLMPTQMARTVMARVQADGITVHIHANVEQKAPGRTIPPRNNCQTGPIRVVLESNLMIRVIPLAGLLLLANALASCSDSKPGAASAPPPPPVTVARPLQKTITEWDEYTGRFVAVEQVEVRARVSGFIDTVNFNEGQLVKQGDPLFVIDP